jgi:phosphatidylserine/phosphatidylglycerophosphate/cardiolipin synthase-like enzyme
VDLLDVAEVRIDIAIYELDRPEITNAILSAHERGVEVRVVTDGDELGSGGFPDLVAGGVPVVARRAGDRIMHNKYAVVDGLAVWSGSANWTETDGLRNNNDAFYAFSSELAAAFAEDHREMFEGGRFGSRKRLSLAPVDVVLDGMGVRARLGPAQDPSELVIEAIEAAEERIWFATYSFTHTGIRDALLAAQARGLEVVGVMDRGQASGASSVDEALIAAGIPVFLDGNENSSGFAGGKLHHKLLVVDARSGGQTLVLTGSANWSGAGTTANDENVVLFADPLDAEAYATTFCGALAVARPAVAGVEPTDAAPICRGRPQLLINEILADPAGTDEGQEYVEIVNVGSAPQELSGLTLWDARARRHTFATGSLAPGGVVVVYDRGDHAAIPGALVASTSVLSLNNTGDTVTLLDAAGQELDSVVYGRQTSGFSTNRSPDGQVGATLVRHDRVSGAVGRLSPGVRVDGGAWGD